MTLKQKILVQQKLKKLGVFSILNEKDYLDNLDEIAINFIINFDYEPIDYDNSNGNEWHSTIECFDFLNKNHTDVTKNMSSIWDLPYIFDDSQEKNKLSFYDIFKTENINMLKQFENRKILHNLMEAAHMYKQKRSISATSYLVKVILNNLNKFDVKKLEIITQVLFSSAKMLMNNEKNIPIESETMAIFIIPAMLIETALHEEKQKADVVFQALLDDYNKLLYKKFELSEEMKEFYLEKIFYLLKLLKKESGNYNLLDDIKLISKLEYANDKKSFYKLSALSKLALFEDLSEMKYHELDMAKVYSIQDDIPLEASYNLIKNKHFNNKHCVSIVLEPWFYEFYGYQKFDKEVFDKLNESGFSKKYLKFLAETNKEIEDFDDVIINAYDLIDEGKEINESVFLKKEQKKYEEVFSLETQKYIDDKVFEIATMKMSNQTVAMVIRSDDQKVIAKTHGHRLLLISEDYFEAVKYGEVSQKEFEELIAGSIFEVLSTESKSNAIYINYKDLEETVKKGYKALHRVN